MPIFNPEDNYIEIPLVDGDFTFTAGTNPSDINADACTIMIDEVYRSSYILNWLIFDTPAVGLTQIRIPLIAADIDNSIPGYFSEPFLKDSGDGFISIGRATFLDSQNGTPVIGTSKLLRVSGLYYIVCDVASGDYDRVLIELNYENSGN